MSSSGSDDKGQGIWSLLPSFDPALDNVREYIEKVKFLEAICPDKDKGMLAPRLAMLCKGTAWGQVKAISPEKLTDKVNGVKNLLAALASWEETAEMKTYELFEKAIYKTTQKSDESATSFVNRLQVAMDELGKVSVKEFHACLLLRQSSLTAEDKKRVLTMTGGEMETTKVEQSMRTLATTILSTEPKKKVYPTNFVETENPNVSMDDESNVNNAYFMQADEEDALNAENPEYLAQGGDEDALLIQQFEKDFEDMVQDIPDLQTALVSYQEARQRISERRRSRGFWPSKSRGKGGRDHGEGHRKGGHRSTKDELLERISRTHCKICGARGHWKAECPRRDMQQPSREQQANMVHVVEGGDDPNFLQVHFEVSDGDEQDAHFEPCFSVQSICRNQHPARVMIAPHIRQQASEFLSSRLSKYRSNSHWGKWGRHKDSQYNAYRTQDPFPRTSVSQHDSPKLAQACPDARSFKQLTNQVPSLECPTGLHMIEDQINQALCKSNVQNGLAILDTGASRSVIGIENVPFVLQKLPENVRCQVREKPSKVGFRFGNNHVAS